MESQMPCDCNGSSVKTRSFGPQIVWTKGGTSPGLNDPFVFSPPDDYNIAPNVAQIRATIGVDHASLNLQTKVIFQSSDDGYVWSAPTDLEAAYTTGNRASTTAWYTNTANFLRYIRVGILAQQASGTNVEMARVHLTIDIQAR
jgi:hypothetical protein